MRSMYCGEGNNVTTFKFLATEQFGLDIHPQMMPHQGKLVD